MGGVVAARTNVGSRTGATTGATAGTAPDARLGAADSVAVWCAHSTVVVDRTERDRPPVDDVGNREGERDEQPEPEAEARRLQTPG